MKEIMRWLTVMALLAVSASLGAAEFGWIEKFYPGLEAGGRVNFPERGYLGKEPAIELVYVSGMTKFGVAKEVTTECRGVVNWTVSANISGPGGSVAAAMEFYDAAGESLKLVTGRRYDPKPGAAGKENWDRASWKFTSPKKAVKASVHLLSTGKKPVKFAKVDIRSAPGVDTEEMPLDVKAWPVDWNPDWHGGEPDMVNFSDAPLPVTFALFGEQSEVKDAAFEIVMPEGLEIRDAYCANYHEYGREEPASSAAETFGGVAACRYRFANPIATRCLKRQQDLDRLYGITMVIAPKRTMPGSGEYLVGYRVVCNGKPGVERTFKMKYQPLPKGLKRAPNFQVFCWNDQDRNFSRDEVYAESMKAYAAAGLITKHRNGIYRPDPSYNQAQCESKRATEILNMIKRDYPEAIISFELQDLWCPYNCCPTPELAKDIAAHMAKTIDAAHMHKGAICPQYFISSKKLRDHLRDNVINADLRRFGVKDGDWVELDMEPWECQTWCFCDDCLKAFAEFYRLDHVPTIAEAGADRDKWADFRTSQSMRSTQMLAEMIHAYNPKLVVVDYDYILEYGNEEAEKAFRRECAKDALKNEQWLDGHLASYYHTIGKAAFDAIRNNVRHLRKFYYPMGGLAGYGGYLRPGEVLDDKQFRQLGLAALVNGCPGWAFYNGTCFDGRQIIAMMRVQDDAARYGKLPWGRVDGKLKPVCANPLFAYASTVTPDGKEILALFNYDRNESITVTVAGRQYVIAPSDVRFIECAAPAAARTQLRGALGEKFDAVLRARLTGPEARTSIYDEAVRAFATHYDGQPTDSQYCSWHCPGRGMWQGEYWGKMMLAGALASDYRPDADFRSWLRKSALDFVRRYQRSDGYLSTYADPAFMGGPDGKGGEVFCWNVWSQKYTLWALQELSRVTETPELLTAARRLADHLIAQLESSGHRLAETGYFSGLPSCSILKPMLMLYRTTGDARYLDWCRGVVADFDRADGRCPNLIANAFSGKPIHEWYPNPERWAKAYELMSCLEGLLLYSDITGDRRVHEAVVRLESLIRAHEVNVLGGAGYHDHFLGAASRANAVTEVCDVIHWMFLEKELYLRDGGNARLDAIEYATFNAFSAGVYRDGRWGAHDVRSHGRRQATAPFEVEMHYHVCCVANAPRGFLAYADLAAVGSQPAGPVDLNFYTDGVAAAAGVTFEISGGYPIGTNVTVAVHADGPRQIRLRVPGWCRRMTVDGEVAKGERFAVNVSGDRALAVTFDMSPVVHERSATPGAAAYPEQFELITYCPESTFSAIREMRGYATRGPLLLAKCKAAGASDAEIFTSDTVNGRGYAARLTPLAEPESAIGRPQPAGRWLLILEKDGDRREYHVSDYATAADYDDQRNAFSIWL